MMYGRVILRSMPRRRTIPPGPYAAIGQRILQIRTCHKLTQEAFCTAIDTSQGALSDWERGNKRLGLDSAILIRKKFRVTLDWLYFGYPGGLDFEVMRQLNIPLTYK